MIQIHCKFFYAFFFKRRSGSDVYMLKIFICKSAAYKHPFKKTGTLKLLRELHETAETLWVILL